MSPTSSAKSIAQYCVNEPPAKAKKLGARVMKEVTEVMGMGWLSIIEDPTGAAVGLWEPKKKR